MTLGLLAAAVGFALLSGLVSLGACRDALRTWMPWACFSMLSLSGLAAFAAGLLALSTEAVTAQLPLGLPWLAWSVRIDALSGLLLLLIGLVVFAVSIFGPGYSREFIHGRQSMASLGVFSGLFIAGMMLVVVANDAFMFMVAWELMSLSSYFLVAFQHEHGANRRAAFLYLLMAHVGGLSILLAFGILAGFGNGFGFAAMRAAELNPLWATLVFGLGFFGFGMKAGLIPLHAWLPEAHPVAPSHISALMSGVMLKVAVYGFVRLVFDLIGSFAVEWGVVVLLIGAISALLGVLYAMGQTDIKRLLAWSSIENIGVIFMALGLAIIFMASNLPMLGSLGLIAALLHSLNHALFKSLLFLGAGAVIQQTHQHSLEQMGGLLKRLPYTGSFFLIGCLSIASLPPFNGFASEWLTLQTALQGVALESGVLRIMIPVTAAMLALTAALGAMLFVRLYGIAFLGQPRSRQARLANLPSPGMRAAQGILALLCLLLGLMPGVFVQLIAQVPSSLGFAVMKTGNWLWLAPSLDTQVASGDDRGYAAILVLLGLTAAWLLVYGLMRLYRTQNSRRVVPWDCGFGPINHRMQYSATAFAEPIRRIFRPLWQVEEQLEPSHPGKASSELRYQLQLQEPFRKWLYDPLGHWVLATARRVTRLQGGNVRAYLAYSFFTLIFLLWLVS